MTLELEQKALITEQQHDSLLNKYEIIDTKVQTNIYFETEDDYFKTLSSALRVRIIDNKYQLTLKIKAAQAGHTEYNYEIERSELENMMQTKQVPKQLSHMITKGILLTRHAIITTERKTFNYLDHIVELDKTDFGDNIDYEIEIESTDFSRATKTMDALLKENEIEFKPGCSKIKRYYQYKLNK